MFAKTIAGFGALVALAAAQVAPGFPVSAPQSLTLVFGGNNTVSPPGELIPRGDTAQPPRISTPIWAANAAGPVRGVLLAVDSDVPRNNTRIELLHWLASNVTIASGGNGSSVLVVPTGEAPYLQPNPPVGDVPHSYTFIVFQQPANFRIPAQWANITQTRIGFNTSQFVVDAGLTQPIAANYIRVQNLTGTATMTFPPARSPTGSPAASSSAPAAFPGAAAKSVEGGVMAWVGFGMAIVAGVAAVGL